MPDQLFEAVFYSKPVPRSLRTLAVLALVFDRVHFPGVYIPDEVDTAATSAWLAKVRADESLRRQVSQEAYNCIVYALQKAHLDDYCFFGGLPKYAGVLEPETNRLLAAFEEAIYGPPPPNFFSNI
jgi:hypothetical protein